MWGKRPDTIVHEESPFNCEPSPSALSGRYITPADTFYSRNHRPIPDVAKDAWRLAVGGRVETPLTLSFNDLASSFPTHAVTQPGSSIAERLADHYTDIAKRWSAMVSEYSTAGRLGDTVIDALCDPPESFQLHGIVAHVLTYSAHRSGVARAMLAHHGSAPDAVTRSNG